MAEHPTYDRTTSSAVFRAKCADVTKELGAPIFIARSRPYAPGSNSNDHRGAAMTPGPAPTPCSARRASAAPFDPKDDHHITQIPTTVRGPSKQTRKSWRRFYDVIFVNLIGEESRLDFDGTRRVGDAYFYELAPTTTSQHSTGDLRWAEQLGSVATPAAA